MLCIHQSTVHSLILQILLARVLPQHPFPYDGGTYMVEKMWENMVCILEKTNLKEPKTPKKLPWLAPQPLNFLGPKYAHWYENFT